MRGNFLGKLFEHNNRANLQIIQACSALSDDQLDAQPRSATKGGIRSTLSHLAEPWVLMVQIINHATEHREQIKSMLSSQGITPPDIDGWSFGETTNALVRI